MSEPEFEHEIVIPFQDIDAAGIVFFAHLFRYAHEAYERLMVRIDHPLQALLADGRYLLPLVHAEADYRQPLRHGEVVRVRVRVERLGNTAYTLGYRFVDEQDRLRATARTVHVVLDADSRSPTGIPQPLAEALEAYKEPDSKDSTG